MGGEVGGLGGRTLPRGTYVRLGWRPFGLTQSPAQDPPTAPPAQVKRGFSEGSQLPQLEQASRSRLGKGPLFQGLSP